MLVELRNNERLVRKPPYLGVMLVCVVCLLVLSGTVMRDHPYLLVGGVILIVFASMLDRQLVVTDRRLVEYRPLLAWLARRFASLRALETRHRLSLDYERVAEIRDEASRTITLVDRDGGEHQVACASRADASALRDELRALLRAQRARVSSRLPVQAEARAVAVRCPYCRDDLRPNEEQACAACETPHHPECLLIHGGCALLGCNGRGAVRSRTA